MKLPYKYAPYNAICNHFEPFEPYNELPHLPITLTKEVLLRISYFGLKFYSSDAHYEPISDTECGGRCGNVPNLDIAFHWDKLCHPASDV